jgi:RHS repeat-associated protein
VTLPGTGGTVNFVYDPFGRRVKKSSSSSTSVYVYDGADQLQEVDSTGTTVVARYTMGTGIDQPLAEARGATTSFYQADGLGSVTSLTDGTASIANTYTYDSFGNQTASTGMVVNPFRYTARELDSETGLMYYRARYYDTGTGRFVAEDPIRFNGGINFFLYAKNRPTYFTDPDGQRTIVIIVHDSFLGAEIGTHSAVYIDNGGDPIVYDPAGSYTDAKKCGSGNACTGKAAKYGDFLVFHNKAGSKSQAYVFNTSAAEEAQIAKNIEKHGGADPPYCTESVIDVLKGVGPFKNLDSTMFPGTFEDQLKELQKK